MKRTICRLLAVTGIVFLGIPGPVLGGQPAGAGQDFDVPVQLVVKLGMALTKDLKATPEEVDKRITALSVFLVEGVKKPGSIVGLIEKAVNDPKVLEPDGGVVLGVDPSCIDYCRGILKNGITCVVNKWHGCRGNADNSCESCCSNTPPGSSCGGGSDGCAGLPQNPCMPLCENDCRTPLYSVCDNDFHANIHSVWCEAISCYCSCNIPSPACPGPTTCPPPVACP